MKWKKIVMVLIFASLYVLLGNARSIQPNPFIDGAVIAVNMIIPVIAGLIFGPMAGLFTGLLGTGVNAQITQSNFEFLAILPHGAMGMFAGYLRKKYPTPIAASSIMLGHGLNILFFYFAGLIAIETFQNIGFWKGLFFEILVGIVAIIVLVSVYKLVMVPKKSEKKIKFTMSGHPKVWRLLVIITVMLTLIFGLLFYFRSIFLSFVMGISLIIITEKLRQDFNFKVKKYRIKGWKIRVYSYLYILFWIFIIGFIAYISIGEMTFSLNTLREGDLTITDQIIVSVEPFIPSMVSERISTESALIEIERYLVGLLSNLLTVISRIFFSAILIIPLMFYMYYKRKDAILKGFFNSIPKRYRGAAKSAYLDITVQMTDFFSAKVTQSILVAIILSIGFFSAGVKGWLFLALLAGFLNIIPYVGPILGAIPPLLIALLDSPTIGIYVLIAVIIAQLVDNLYSTPIMISSRVRVNPLLTIVLILAGAQLLGALGMVFAIPIYIVYKIILREFHNELEKIRF